MRLYGDGGLAPAFWLWRFGAEIFWLQRFGAESIGRQEYLALGLFGAKSIWRLVCLAPDCFSIILKSKMWQMFSNECYPIRMRIKLRSILDTMVICFPTI